MTDINNLSKGEYQVYLETEHNISQCFYIRTLFPDLVDDVFVQAMLVTGYSLIFVLGVVGNLLSAFCFLRLKVNVGIHTYFALSLTTSDLLILLLSLPFTSINIYTREWIFGRLLCKGVSVFQGIGIFVSSFTLAAIAMDRYRIVRRKMFSGPSTRSLQYMCVVASIWLLATILIVPYAWRIMIARRYAGLCGLYCEENWGEDAKLRISYGVTIAIIQFVLPLLVLAFCYHRLKREVVRNIHRRCRYSVSEETHNLLRQKRRKNNKMTLLLFAAFVIPWLPFNALNLLRDFHLVPLSVEYLAYAVGHLIAMTSTMWNPIIYCWLNEELRAALTKALFSGSGSASLANSNRGLPIARRAAGATAAGVGSTAVFTSRRMTLPVPPCLMLEPTVVLNSGDEEADGLPPSADETPVELDRNGLLLVPSSVTFGGRLRVMGRARSMTLEMEDAAM